MITIESNVVTNFSRKAEVVEVDWKDTLDLLLKQLTIISSKETGKLVINLNQGGVTSLEKTVILK